MKSMTIEPGEVYWVVGNHSDIAHPHVVIEVAGSQARVYSVTTNLKRVSMPGNVLLEIGEGNLPRQSVVEVSKVFTLEKNQLEKYIGKLSPQRVSQILSGVAFLKKMIDKG